MWSRVLICCFLMQCAQAQDYSFDRTLDKLAGEMLRAHPELQGLRKSSEVRAELVKEFRDLGIEDVSRSTMRDKRRRKIDYEAYGWVTLLQKFERAKLEQPQAQFLLEIAKEQKLRFDEHYVVEKLMYFYLKRAVAEREERSRDNLAEVGKQFTYFVRANGRDPNNLAEFVKRGDQMLCVDPESGEEEPWVFVGAGPAEIRGGNGYRVVAYSPFDSGSRNRYRWVVYRGGRVTEWKSTTVLAAHKRMEKNNADQLEREQKLLTKQQSTTAAEVVIAQKEMAAALAESLDPEPEPQPKKKALRITIRELW